MLFCIAAGCEFSTEDGRGLANHLRIKHNLTAKEIKEIKEDQLLSPNRTFDEIELELLIPKSKRIKELEELTQTLNERLNETVVVAIDEDSDR